MPSNTYDVIVVGGVVHHDREPELLRADHAERDDHREEARPPGHQRHGAENQAPGLP